MSSIERIIDKINRWSAFFERIRKAASVIGVQPMAIAATVAAIGGLTVWAAKATPIIQSFAPLPDRGDDRDRHRGWDDARSVGPPRADRAHP